MQPFISAVNLRIIFRFASYFDCRIISQIPFANQRVGDSEVDDEIHRSDSPRRDSDVNGSSITNLNPPAPPIGFGRLTGGITYPVKSPTIAASTPFSVPVSVDQNTTSFRKTIMGFDSTELTSTS